MDTIGMRQVLLVVDFMHNTDQSIENALAWIHNKLQADAGRPVNFRLLLSAACTLEMHQFLLAADAVLKNIPLDSLRSAIAIDILDAMTYLEVFPSEKDNPCPNGCPVIYPGDTEYRTMRCCGHRFHRQCVDPWISLHKVCPRCMLGMAMFRVRSVSGDFDIPQSYVDGVVSYWR
ncbi:unnamed protein product (mitochondrion) [Plasmodiophora brassicae]|nr:unnamed protein product [Plasmodiophora brassicae]